MPDLTSGGEWIRNALLALGICAGVGVTGATVLLWVAFRQVAEIEIPDDADFFETLQMVPITVPLALDFLDLAFDVFSAPISWVVLELLGLRQLQMITVFEGIIPGTQIIPTMTIAWFVARNMRKKNRQSDARDALRSYDENNRYARRSGTALADQIRRRELLPSGSDSNVVEGDFYEEGYEDGIDDTAIDHEEADY